ncbi:MmcQ/YjbR family DNA-binding protein [Geodermatophilus sp. CPCC 206100]|uniref:MmcQ/YjbR family DNA-binding protein n=1 Tax=Geodermatophilus sp. CPCC 206100 TaxID=3020054 RepID=UPI003B00DAF2
MATWSDVRTVALGLPEVGESDARGRLEWRVRDKGFVWERALRRADLAALGDAAPEGPVLAAWVPDLGAKEALLADDPAVYFTTPHFNGYPVVLIRLEELDPAELPELVTEAWLARAPKRLARQFLDAAT